jgi:type I restriction enzyme S subunit
VPSFKRFRTAVLAGACTGRLTADWREAHHAATPRDATSADNAIIGTVPDAWQVVTVGRLIDRIEAGKSFQALPRPARDNEWGVIKVSAMSWGRFLQDENKAAQPGYVVNPAYEIHQGDLLLSRANTVELVGATVLVDETRPRLLLSDKSLRLVPHSGVSRAWLNYALSSPPTRRQFENDASGTSNSMRNLSRKKILGTKIALPSVEEQHEIVHRVAAMLGAADRLAAQVKRVAVALDRVPQASLAKAFRGELVPIEAALAEEEGRDYEPADVLLARAKSGGAR